MKITKTERHWVQVVGRAFVPVGVLGGLTDQCDFGAEFEKQWRNSPWYAAIVVRIGLLLVWLSPLFVMRKLSRFGGLPEAERVVCLERLLVFPNYVLRQMVILVKMGVAMAAIGHEDVLVHIGAYRTGRSALPISAHTPTTEKSAS